MRRAIALALSLTLTLTGCAAHGAHAAQAPDRLHDWRSVRAIRPGTHVLASLDSSVSDGFVEKVTDSSVTIRTASGLWTTARASVVRVQVPVTVHKRNGWLDKPLTVGIFGGLAGTVVGAVMRNADVAGISLEVFAASAVVGLHHILKDYGESSWRVVYVRR